MHTCTLLRKGCNLVATKLLGHQFYTTYVKIILSRLSGGFITRKMFGVGLTAIERLLINIYALIKNANRQNPRRK